MKQQKFNRPPRRIRISNISLEEIGFFQLNYRGACHFFLSIKCENIPANKIIIIKKYIIHFIFLYTWRDSNPQLTVLKTVVSAKFHHRCKLRVFLE